MGNKFLEYEYFNRGYTPRSREVKWPQGTRYECTKLSDKILQAVFNAPVGKENIGIMLSGGMDSSMIYYVLQHDDYPCYVTGTTPDQDKATMWKNMGADVRFIKDPAIKESLEIVDRLSKSAYFRDCPIQFNSAIPLYKLCAQANKDGIRYLISGEGGDEIFWGYPRYKHFIETIKQQHNTFSFAELVYYGSGLHNKPIVQNLVNQWKREKCFEWLLEHERTEPHQLVCMFDQVWRLPQLIYRNERIGNIFGIKFVYPLMDPELVDYVNELSIDFKFRNGIQRYAQREIAKDWLPPEIWNQPKQPFDSAFSQWFKTDACAKKVQSMPWNDWGLSQDTVDLICQAHKTERHFDVLMQKLFYYGKFHLDMPA